MELLLVLFIWLLPFFVPILFICLIIYQAKKTNQTNTNPFKAPMPALEWLESLDIHPDSNGHYDLRAAMPNGNPILIEAMIQEKSYLLSDLIKLGADVNAMDSEGKTALFFARNPWEVKALTKAGAIVDARDIHGKTAFFYMENAEQLSPYITAPNIDSDANSGRHTEFSAASNEETLVFGNRFTPEPVQHTALQYGCELPSKFDMIMNSGSMGTSPVHEEDIVVSDTVSDDDLHLSQNM